MKILSLLFFLISIPSAYPAPPDNSFPVPPIIKGSEIDLTMEKGFLSLPAGESRSMGFNGSYLGPTIRVKKGDFLKINIKNKLGEDSTVHWHGLHVPAEYDGGPHQIIEKGTVRKPQFKINQNAATLWYHPHLIGKTAEHVYKGLAGLFIIDDEYSKNQNIPRDYGINDFPVILQEKRLNSKGQFSYRPGMHDIMTGYTGNIMLVNGVLQPELKINQGTYRFRILNGSNSSILQVSFSDSRIFTVIASDGGFLPASARTDNIILSPGERFEILADFNKEETLSLISAVAGGNRYKSVDISVSSKKSKFFTHPEYFTYDPVKADNSRQADRSFIMETRGMRGFRINGRKMEMDRIDFTVKLNTPEKWTIESSGMGMMGMMTIPHSFHVHDVQFSVVSINGKPPSPLYSGPKDTILVMPGNKVEIALNFRDYTGIYMYHCHFLEHEDEGMMGQFKVVP